MAGPEPHETLVVGILLSLVGGFLDAYTFLLAGGVFANAQTGNVVLLAISLFDADRLAFLKYLFPLAAFVGGIAVAELLRTSRAGKGTAWVLAVLALEAVWLTVVGFLFPSLSHQWVNCGISFVAALQVTAFKKLGPSPYSTTMITGNLRSAVELLLRARTDRAALGYAARYGIVIGGFVAGAAAGAVLCGWWAWHSVFVPVAALMAALAIVARPRRMP